MEFTHGLSIWVSNWAGEAGLQLFSQAAQLENGRFPFGRGPSAARIAFFLDLQDAVHVRLEWLSDWLRNLVERNRIGGAWR